jgi:hypothetical protein
VSPSAAPDSTAAFPPRKPGASVGQVFAFVAGFIALAAVGAAIGWFATDSPTKPVAASSTPPAPTVGPSSPSPTPSVVPSVTVTGNALPDFRALNITFSDARDKLRDLGLGVQLIFNDAGQGATVDHTVPPAGSVVKRGTTVKIYVTGPAPLLTVPDITGERCGQGGKDVAAAGLIPSYPDGKIGDVMSTEPTADDPQTHWNDPIQVHCGTGPIGGPSDNPSDPAGGSPSPSTNP